MYDAIHIIDKIIILIYFSFLFLIGFIKKGPKDNQDYLLSGRRLTLPIFVMTLVSTWYGGILGVGEFTYLYGLSNWLVMDLPYYIFALIYALFIAKKIRNSESATIPELMETHFDTKTSVLSSIFVFILTSPAAYLLTAGILLSFAFNIPPLICSIIIFAISAIYLYKKGFESVIQSDVFQFILMFVGFSILLGFLLVKFPFHEYISTLHLPAKHLSFKGDLTVLYIISWFFIAMWTLVDPGFHQRCASAKTPEVAQKGILVSILFWMVFDALTLSTGLYAKALLPNIEALYAYPSLAAYVLPTGLLGLFLTGLLATVMSTLDSHLFISAQTIGYDVLSKFKGMELKKSIRIGYLLTGAFAYLLIFFFPSVIDLWYFIGTLIIPALIIPVMFALFKKKMRKHEAFSIMLGSFCISGIFFLLKYGFGLHLAGIEPFYPGLLSSILIFTGFKIVDLVKR